MVFQPPASQLCSRIHDVREVAGSSDAGRMKQDGRIKIGIQRREISYLMTAAITTQYCIRQCIKSRKRLFIYFNKYDEG
ncbi:hypothetical protein AWENTII_001037 [Aspergillus wentii]